MAGSSTSIDRVRSASGTSLPNRFGIGLGALNAGLPTMESRVARGEAIRTAGGRTGSRRANVGLSLVALRGWGVGHRRSP
jgi:hypothetical protein